MKDTENREFEDLHTQIFKDQKDFLENRRKRLGSSVAFQVRQAIDWYIEQLKEEE